MSGTHDPLIKEKADGFKEASSAASRPAEKDRKRMEPRGQRTPGGVETESMSDAPTNDVAQIRDLVLRPAAGSVQHGHSQTFQPPQNLDGAPKAVHGIDSLPVTARSSLTNRTTDE